MAEQTQGTPSPQEGTAGEAPKAISLDDVNKAITARFSVFEKKLSSTKPEWYAQEQAAKQAAREEKEAAKAAEAEKARAGAAPATEPTTGEAKPTPAPAIEDHPAFKSLQKQLSELKNKAAADAKEKEQLAAEKRDAALRSKLGEALGKHGITGPAAKGAMALLIDGEKRARYSKDGSFEFVDSNGETVDFAEGVTAWASTDDAKIYLPPRGAAGSGERPTNAGNGRGSAQLDPESALKRAIAAHYGF